MKSFFAVLIAASVIFGLSKVNAITILNNGSGSQNSVTINNGSSSTIQQGSSLQIQNNVDANSNTGNNTASGNNGNTTIKTGDATSIVGVTNNGNNNNVTSSPCCTTPTQTIKPTSTPRINPTPTPDPGNPNNGGGGSDTTSSNNNTNNSSGSNSSQGQGEILGLANTASGDLPMNIFTTLGVICLAIGSILLIKNGIVRN